MLIALNKQKERQKNLVKHFQFDIIYIWITYLMTEIEMPEGIKIYTSRILFLESQFALSFKIFFPYEL